MVYDLNRTVTTRYDASVDAADESNARAAG